MPDDDWELVACVSVPGLVVVSEANRRDHWAVRRRRAREQAEDTILALATLGPRVKARLQRAKRVRVRFVRLGGRKLDSDNLAGAFKAVRDALCNRWLKIDDGSNHYEWEWPQQESGPKGIRIELRVDRG